MINKQNFIIFFFIKLKTQMLNTKKLEFRKEMKNQLPTKSLLVRTTWNLDNRGDVVRAAFCKLAMFFTHGNKSKRYDLIYPI